MAWRHTLSPQPSGPQQLKCPMHPGRLTFPIVQISLDLTSLDEAIETAAVAVDAGVDWLEAGTPLLLAHGLRAVEALRQRFPDHPIVADLKTMDGGYLETEMMAKAGADLVVVMGRAHEATIRRVVDAGRDYGIKVMGDNLAADDRVASARWMEQLGVDFIVHHIGFDERNLIRGLSPLDELDAVVRAVELREIAVPEIGEDDVLLEVGAVSVCGSDVHQARNTHSWPVDIPVVLGHEFGGTVAQLGRAVRGFREGDRVVSETAARICG